MSDYKTIQELEGKTLTKVEHNNEEVVFDCSDGSRFQMYHSQDCCESVWLDRIDGDLQKLIGNKIVKAVEQPGHEFDPQASRESVTFTDFVLTDDMGREVTLHWIGESNGYYSESVYFVKL